MLKAAKPVGFVCVFFWVKLLHTEASTSFKSPEDLAPMARLPGSGQGLASQCLPLAWLVGFCKNQCPQEKEYIISSDSFPPTIMFSPMRAEPLIEDRLRQTYLSNELLSCKIHKGRMSRGVEVFVCV